MIGQVFSVYLFAPKLGTGANDAVGNENVVDLQFFIPVKGLVISVEGLLDLSRNVG